jgi:hypothetical protein
VAGSAEALELGKAKGDVLQAERAKPTLEQRVARAQAALAAARARKQNLDDGFEAARLAEADLVASRDAAAAAVAAASAKLTEYDAAEGDPVVAKRLAELKASLGQALGYQQAAAELLIKEQKDAADLPFTFASLRGDAVGQAAEKTREVAAAAAPADRLGDLFIAAEQAAREASGYWTDKVDAAAMASDAFTADDTDLKRLQELVDTQAAAIELAESAAKGIFDTRLADFQEMQKAGGPEARTPLGDNSLTDNMKILLTLGADALSKLARDRVALTTTSEELAKEKTEGPVAEKLRLEAAVEIAKRDLARQQIRIMFEVARVLDELLR